jgi:hypothetical protein
MALGVQLYLVKQVMSYVPRSGLDWLHTHVPCAIELFGRCPLDGIPRFCTDDVVEKGCVMRPGDAAALSATVTFLQRNMDLQALPNGRLRGYLGTMSGQGPQLEEISSYVNKPGFSQHLVGVSILLYRMLGFTDKKLDEAAERLAKKIQAMLSFILARRPQHQIISEVLYRCPNPNIPLKPPLHQWQWERENEDMAWESSCYWDCIFIRGLAMQNKQGTSNQTLTVNHDREFDNDGRKQISFDQAGNGNHQVQRRWNDAGVSLSILT